MASSDKEKARQDEKKKAVSQQDDDVIGKAYDGRLMRRLLTYLYPYKWAAFISIGAILIKATCDVLGPYLTEVAIDRYMTAHPTPRTAFLARWLSADPFRGIAQIALIYLGSLLLSFVLEFIQTYLMQWTGQKIMFDLRRQIFGHLQRMHVGFYDRNPVGRLVTRLTSDVDALNEMFTSGVFAIFEDIFVLAGIVFVMLRMKWWLALLAFSRAAADLCRDADLPQVCAGYVPADSHGDCADQQLYAGTYQRDEPGAAVQPAEARVSRFRGGEQARTWWRSRIRFWRMRFIIPWLKF